MRQVAHLGQCRRLRCHHTRQRNLRQSGYSTNAFNTSVGADTLIGDNTLIGIAGRFDNLWTTTTEPTTFGKTEGWSGMLYAKQRLTPATWLSGSFSAGGFSTDITRQVNIPGYPSTEQGSSAAPPSAAASASATSSTPATRQPHPSLGLQLAPAQPSPVLRNHHVQQHRLCPARQPADQDPNPGKASYALTYDAATYNSIPLEIGLSYKQPFKASSTTLIPASPLVMPGISVTPTAPSPRALTPLPKGPSRSMAHQRRPPGSTSVSALISLSMTASPSTSTASVSSHLPAPNPSTTAAALGGPSDQPTTGLA